MLPGCQKAVALGLRRNRKRCPKKAIGQKRSFAAYRNADIHLKRGEITFLTSI